MGALFGGGCKGHSKIYQRDWLARLHLKCWKEEFIASLCEDYIIDCGSFCDGGTDDCIVARAIDAIKTLLAERDDAIQKLVSFEQSHGIS